MTSADDLLSKAEARSSAVWGRQSGSALDEAAGDDDQYRRAFETFVDRGDAERAEDVAARRAVGVEDNCPSEDEVEGASRGVAELVELINRKQLIALLADPQPFGSRDLSRPIQMQRVPPAKFRFVQP